jgi:hypothetical protein
MAGGGVHPAEEKRAAHGVGDPQVVDERGL